MGMATNCSMSTLWTPHQACPARSTSSIPVPRTFPVTVDARMWSGKVQTQQPGRHFVILARVATKKQAKSPAEEDWSVKREYLVKNQVRSVRAKEAYRLQKEDGYVILDVRPVGDFKEGHPEGAVNAQVYRLIKEWTAWDIARRAAFAFFGIFSGTEENPEFLNEVRSKVDKDAKVIVACSAGGTMRPSASLAEGQQSRSLIAAYLLKLDGFKSIVHLEGGLRTWFKEELPSTSED